MSYYLDLIKYDISDSIIDFAFSDMFILLDCFC